MWRTIYSTLTYENVWEEKKEATPMPERKWIYGISEVIQKKKIIILRQTISLRLLNSTSRTECQPCLCLSNSHVRSHVFPQSTQSRTFYELESRPAKEFLVLKKKNLLGRSTTGVNICNHYMTDISMYLYIPVKHRLITVCVCTFIFSEDIQFTSRCLKTSFLNPKHVNEMKSLF